MCSSEIQKEKTKKLQIEILLMANCEMCSKPATTKAKIEGVILSVCSSCASFGSEVKVNPVFIRRPTGPTAPKSPDTVLVVDVGIRVRKARQKMGLSEKDAAMKLNIRESTLLHIESGKIIPDDMAAKKLERFFNIKLFEAAN